MGCLAAPVLPFFPGPRVGPAVGTGPAPWVWEVRSVGGASSLCDCSPPPLTLGDIQALAPPGMEPWAVRICKTLLPPTPEDTGSIQWLPLLLSHSTQKGRMA